MRDLPEGGQDGDHCASHYPVQTPSCDTPPCVSASRDTFLSNAYLFPRLGTGSVLAAPPTWPCPEEEWRWQGGKLAFPGLETQLLELKKETTEFVMCPHSSPPTGRPRSYSLLPPWESFRPASYLPLKAKLRLWLLHSHSWLHRYRQPRPPGRPQWAAACTPAHRGGTCTWSRWTAAGPPCTRKFWAVVCLISQRRSERACRTAR